MKKSTVRRFTVIKSKNHDGVSIIPLGGLGEIGKNMTAIKCDNEILIIDAGLMFPEEELLGIDIVIPDISYLLENRDMVKGVVITHGHEDHIGGLPYLLREINVPVYSMKLTIGLIETKLKETTFVNTPRLHVVKPRQEFKVGSFRVELIRTCHSIPDAVSVAVHTRYGIIFHSGDFNLTKHRLMVIPSTISVLPNWETKAFWPFVRQYQCGTAWLQYLGKISWREL